jgi:lantibiotic modifying enzyme
MAELITDVLFGGRTHLTPEATATNGNSQDAAFLEAAHRIGNLLCRDALWAEGQCAWLGWSMEPIAGKFTACYRAMPPVLYNGTAGIALFLAHLSRRTQERAHAKCLRGSVNHIVARCGEFETPSTLGYFTGLTGLAYTLIQIGELTQDEGLIETGLKALIKTGDISWHENLFDVMGGFAGTIPVLIDVAQRLDQPALLEIARRQATGLLNAAQAGDGGVSWPSPIQQQKNLTGYSHGVAGIGLALIELHRVTHDDALLKTGLEAIHYERNAFDPVVENWLDYRVDFQIPGQAPAQGRKHSATWCNGATGIGCSRLRLLRLQPNEPLALREVDVAMSAVLKSLPILQSFPPPDLTLCHGLGGWGDFLLQIADRFNREDVRKIALNIGWTAVQTCHAQNLPWPCGVPAAGETPGLMLGTAGIGYFLLRLMDSHSVPSVLLVSPALSEPPAMQADSLTSSARTGGRVSIQST